MVTRPLVETIVPLLCAVMALLCAISEPASAGIPSNTGSSLHPAGVPASQHYSYVPLVIRSIPPLTQTLETDFLFVELWQHRQSGPSCPWKSVDSIPTYTFNPYSMILTSYPPDPALKLQPVDVGYLGAGGSSEQHFANSLHRVQALPDVGFALTLYGVNAAGTVDLNHDGHRLLLAPEAEWLSVSVTQTSAITTCRITTTLRLTNFGFVPRQNIRYYNVRSSFANR